MWQTKSYPECEFLRERLTGLTLRNVYHTYMTPIWGAQGKSYSTYLTNVRGLSWMLIHMINQFISVKNIRSHISHRNFFEISCIFWWTLRCEIWENFLGHASHLYNLLTGLWWFICIFEALLLLYRFSQIKHSKAFSSISR